MATTRYRQSPPHSFGINDLALAQRLLFTRAEGLDPQTSRSLRRVALLHEMQVAAGEHEMAYRIKRSTIGRDVTFFLSGEIDSDHVAELEALIATEASRLVCLDLAEVTLVTREAVKALARVEAAGAVLVNCPDYVRSWIDGDQDGA